MGYPIPLLLEDEAHWMKGTFTDKLIIMNDGDCMTDNNNNNHVKTTHITWQHSYGATIQSTEHYRTYVNKHKTCIVNRLTMLQ